MKLNNKDKIRCFNGQKIKNPPYITYNNCKDEKTILATKYHHSESKVNIQHLEKQLKNFLDHKKVDIIKGDFVLSRENIIDEDRRFILIYFKTFQQIIKNWVSKNI